MIGRIGRKPQPTERERACFEQQRERASLEFESRPRGGLDDGSVASRWPGPLTAAATTSFLSTEVLDGQGTRVLSENEIGEILRF